MGFSTSPFGGGATPNALTLNPANGKLILPAGTTLVAQSGQTIDLSGATVVLPADVPRLDQTYGSFYFGEPNNNRDTASIIINPSSGVIAATTFNGTADYANGAFSATYASSDASTGNPLSTLFDGTGGNVSLAGRAYADAASGQYLSGLFDGSGGNVQYAQFAQFAQFATQDSNGNLLSTLFDGTAGNVAYATAAENADYATTASSITTASGYGTIYVGGTPYYPQVTAGVLTFTDTP